MSFSDGFIATWQYVLDDGLRRFEEEGVSRRGGLVERKYRGFGDLKVYQFSYSLAMEIFHESKGLLVDERYSWVDQIRRSTQSIPANLNKTRKKGRYGKLSVSELIDSAGKAAEIEVWVYVAQDCGHIQRTRHRYYDLGYGEVNKMPLGMIQQPEKLY